MPPVLLPFEVDPLIKFGRWTMLVAGIIYGYNRQRWLEVSEKEFRIQDGIRKAELAKHLEREKAIANAAELNELERMFLGNEKSSENFSDE